MGGKRTDGRTGGWQEMKQSEVKGQGYGQDMGGKMKEM